MRTSTGKHDPALAEGQDANRFLFGDNWLDYLASIDERRIRQAEHSICALLQTTTLEGRSFLDAGSGSGLFSLAARRLGARVSSFDFDERSVEATGELRRRYRDDDPQWTIQQGSVLDDGFMRSLGMFDVVYAWGVLHHTGDMWRGLANITYPVRSGGTLCLAIYNDQGWASDVWRVVKRTYNRLPPPLRGLILWPVFGRLWGPMLIRDLVRGRPFMSWSTYRDERGMSPMVDLKDWVGGYPFEVAAPHEVVAFFTGRQFAPTHSVLRTGIGCNEFAFVRNPPDTDRP